MNESTSKNYINLRLDPETVKVLRDFRMWCLANGEDVPTKTEAINRLCVIGWNYLECLEVDE